MRVRMRTGAAMALACLCGEASSFALPPPSHTISSSSPSSSSSYARRCRRPRSSFASPASASAGVDEDGASSSTAPAITSSRIGMRVLDGTERSMRNAADFMVDAFWLASCRDASRRSSLVEVQANDLMEKYGERMGKRKLDAVVIAAVEEVGDARAASSSSAGVVGGTDGIRGLVTVEVRLLERGRDLLSSEESEIALTRAVSSLGPKQRREYKDASAMEVANGLLSPDYIAICSLSNLCVSHAARRGGVAKRLCTEAERVARDVFGFDEMYLRVEKSNLAALGLYEERLGYVRSFDVNGATAMRADADSGSFVEVNTDIVVLRKRI